MVTLYAYDLPFHLVEKYKGFLSRECVEDYLRYVKTVVSAYKGRVKYWVPFNEQNLLMFDTMYMIGYACKDRQESFTAEHHMNLAYARATKLIHEIDPEAKTGGNVGNICPYPATCKVEDVEACETYKYLVGYNYISLHSEIPEKTRNIVN